ncbi:MAG: hypothetical protein AMJ75_06870 [Phycisphaerae bacterium SM1_79]|nr:MAG: hypothetical protein AMJ75_06870 [Phycisphaerae bacterium SM1_79]
MGPDGITTTNFVDKEPHFVAKKPVRQALSNRISHFEGPKEAFYFNFFLFLLFQWFENIYILSFVIPITAGRFGIE